MAREDPANPRDRRIPEGFASQPAGLQRGSHSLEPGRAVPGVAQLWEGRRNGCGIPKEPGLGAAREQPCQPHGNARSFPWRALAQALPCSGAQRGAQLSPAWSGNSQGKSRGNDSPAPQTAQPRRGQGRELPCPGPWVMLLSPACGTAPTESPAQLPLNHPGDGGNRPPLEGQQLLFPAVSGSR